MWCRSVRNLLSAYADGELGPSERRAVEEHLSACAGCARDYAGIEQVVRLTVMIPEEDVPSRLHTRIMSGLAYSTASATLVPPRPRALRGHWLLPALAGMTAMAGVVLLNGRLLSPPADRPFAPEAVPSARKPSPPTADGSRRQVAGAPQTPGARDERSRTQPGRPGDRPGERELSRPSAPAERMLATAPVPEQPRGKPLPVRGGASSGNPVTEPRAVEPAAPALIPSQPPQELVTMPGSPVVNTTGPVGQPEATMPAMEKDGGMRMAGMMGMASDGKAQSEEDERIRALRLFLKERERGAPPAPPADPRSESRSRTL